MSRKPFVSTNRALRAVALLSASVALHGLLATPASAQQDFQNVSATGRVEGPDGNGIGGATVTITSNDQGFSRTATTTSDGSYRIPQLAPGNYSFSVSANGFETFKDPNVALTLSGAANAFTLVPANAATTAGAGEVVVRGRRTVVTAFDQNTTGAVVNVTDIASRVPVGRTLNSIIQLTPGTARGDSAFGDLPSIGGASVGENAYYVNGLNITNFRTFLGSNSVPFEFYDTIQVKDGAYPAEFGRSTGAFVSATTKSGSNDFHAGSVVTYQPNGLSSHAPNTLTSDNDNDYSTDLRADFYASGPIIKDHLFFYGLYESRYVKTGSGGTLDRNPNYTFSTTTSPFFAGKVDAIITNGQRLEFTYFRTKGHNYNDTYSYNSDTNQIGEFVGAQRTNYGGDNYVGRYTGTFTNWFTVSAAYGRSKNRDDAISSIPDIAYVEDDRGDPAQVPGSNPNPTITRNDDKRVFYRADADLYFKLFGSHHVRFGYDHEDLTTVGTTSYTSGRYYQIFTTSSRTYCGVNGPATCDYVRARDFENGGRFKVTNEAYYAEDNWSLLNDRVSLNLGIRNDRFNNRNIDGVSFYKSGDQWGPRIGASFDPIGDGRQKVYFNFARYFLPIAANTDERLGGAEYDVYSYYKFSGLDANGQPVLTAPITRSSCVRPDFAFNVTNNCVVVSDGSTASTAATVADNLKPQSADEYILGYELKLGNLWTVEAYGTYRKLNRALEDSAVDAAARRYCQAQGFSADDCAAIYTGFAQYVLNNPGGDITTQLTLPDGTTPTVTLTNLGYPKAKRKYEAVTLEVKRAFDGKWSLDGSYTYSKTIGNYEGSVTSDNGQTDAGLTQDFDQPELTYGAYGYLPNDRRHNIKLYGSYQLFDWLNLGANIDIQSPRHFGCFGTLPDDLTDFSSTINAAYGAAARYCRYADGQVSDDNPIVQVRRGTGFHTDWSKEVDLTAQFTLPITSFQAKLGIDVFNVFNSKSVLDANEFGANDDGSTRSDYRAPLSYQTPRYVRMQLQLRF